MISRKLFPFAALLVILALLVAGCAQTAEPEAVEPEPPAEEPTAEAPAEPAEPAEEVTLTFSDWHLTEPHWEASLIEAFETFKADNPNIDLELDYVSYADKDTKYATEIDAGAGPDVFHLHAYSLRSFIERGFLQDITPFIDQEGGEAFLEFWYPQTLELMQHEGSYYAIPADFMSMALFYNSNLYEEAGLDADKAPATWDEFLANAQALTRDRDGDGQTDSWGFGTIGAISPGFELRFTPILFSHGGEYLNKDMTCSALDSPEAKEAFTFFTNLFTEEGVIPPGVTSQNPGTVREQMGNEQAAMLLGSGWTAPIVDGINEDWDAFEVLQVADVPVKAGTDPDYTTTAWLSAWAMNPNTEHPEEAWELIKFLTAKEQEQKWFEDARVTSARMDVSEGYEPLVNDKFAKAIAGQLAKAKFVPQIKEWPQIIETVNSAAQEAFTGDKTPEEALEDAHSQINEILGCAEAEAPAEPAEEVTLTFSDWHLTEPHWEASLIEAFETFKADNPNIDLELDYVSYADKDTKYATEIDAGAGPDVFHLHAYSLRSFIERGFLQDITPFIDQEGGDAFLEPWYPQTLELMQDEGSYYAIPADFMSMALFYNSNLYEEAGLDPDKAPATWDEFLANAQALTRDRDGDGQTDSWGFGTIGAISPGFELRFTPILFSHGGEYLNEDLTCSALNSPEAREAFAFFTNLFTEQGVIPPGVTAQNPGTVREQMGNEQAAMLLGSGWTAPIVDGINEDWDAFEVLEVADVPIKAGTDPDYTTTAWLSAWAMNPNTEHPEEAWELVKFLTAKEQEQKWFEDARVTSARMDVSEEYEPLVNDKFAKAIAGQLAKAKFVPQIKEWPQIIETVNSAAQEAFTGDKTPDEALEDAHNQINDILGGDCPGF